MSYIRFRRAALAAITLSIGAAAALVLRRAWPAGARTAKAVNPGESASKTVEVLTYESAPFNVTRVQCDQELFSVALQSISAGVSHRATITFHPTTAGAAVIRKEIVFLV